MPRSYAELIADRQVGGSVATYNADDQSRLGCIVELVVVKIINKSAFGTVVATFAVLAFVTLFAGVAVVAVIV